MVATPRSSAADLGGMSLTTGRDRGQGHPITPVCGSCLSKAPDATGRYLDSPGSTLTPMTDPVGLRRQRSWHDPAATVRR
jgi:hypothetical protein